MRLSILAWDTFDLNTVEYKTSVRVGSGNVMAPAQPIYIDMGAGDPILTSKTLVGTSFTIHVQLLGDPNEAADAQDAILEAQRDALSAVFQPNDFVMHNLYALDVDTSVTWYLQGYTLNAPTLVEGSRNLYSVAIALKTPYWLSESGTMETWNITADTETYNISNNGNVQILPLFELTINAAKGVTTLAKKTFVAMYTDGWGTPTTGGGFTYPLPFDLTPAGVDTATPIGAGDMNSNGYDVMVQVNGVNSSRWFNGLNSADTHIWTLLTFPIPPTMTLAEALDNTSTYTTITVSYSDAAFSVPINKCILIGSELFAYSTFTVDTINNKATFTISERSSKGSALASHSIGAAVKLIPNEIWISYGNAAATAPAALYWDNYYPSFDLATSTNSQWNFSDFSGALNLPNSYTTLVPVMNASAHYYNVTHKNGLTADSRAFPWDVLGLHVSGTTSFSGRYQWTIPMGISNFSATGEKRRVGPSWPNFSIFGNAPGTASTTYYTEPTTSATDTWEPVSFDEALSGNPTFIRFGLPASQALLANSPTPEAQVELQAMTWDLANPPAAVLYAEQDNYDLNAVIENETTGAKIIFNHLPTDVGKTITIDCANQTVTSSDGTVIRSFVRFEGPVRDEWMTFESGVNALRYTDEGTTDVDLVIYYRNRGTL